MTLDGLELQESHAAAHTPPPRPLVDGGYLMVLPVSCFVGRAGVHVPTVTLYVCSLI